MDSDPECFGDAFWAHKNGRMTTEAYIALIARHLNGTRHAEDPLVNDRQLKETAERDLVGAAAKVCMADPDLNIPADLMINILLACTKPTTTLATLSALVDAPNLVLGSPLAVQLLVAFSMTNSNKTLAKSLIDTLEVPPPKSQAIFGPPEFGFCRSAHSGIEKHEDNACDVWLAFIKKGWVKPHHRILQWAIYCHNPADALALATVLMERGILPDQDMTCTAIQYGTADLIPLFLAHYQPSTEKEQHFLLRSAAGRLHPDGAIEVFQLLFRHGMTDINWMDVDTHVDYLVKSWPLNDARGLCEMSWDWSPEQTVLHSAVLGGKLETIEWLIEQGAENQQDGWGRNPHDLARFKERTDVIEILERHGMKGSYSGSKDSLWDPRNTVQAAQARRRGEQPGQKKERCILF